MPYSSMCPLKKQRYLNMDAFYSCFMRNKSPIGLCNHLMITSKVVTAAFICFSLISLSPGLLGVIECDAFRFMVKPATGLICLLIIQLELISIRLHSFPPFTLRDGGMTEIEEELYLCRCLFQEFRGRR